MIDRQLILETVCNYYKLDISLLKSLLRKEKIVKARHVYLYFCHIHTENSLLLNAKLINRDHSTALYAIRKIKNEIELYANFKSEILFINSLIKEKEESYYPLIPQRIDLLELTINHTNSFIKTT